MEEEFEYIEREDNWEDLQHESAEQIEETVNQPKDTNETSVDDLGKENIVESIGIGDGDERIELTIDSSFAVFSVSCPSKCPLDTLFGIVEKHLPLPRQFTSFLGNATYTTADSAVPLDELSISNGALLVLVVHIPVIIDGEQKAIDSADCVSANFIYFSLVNLLRGRVFSASLDYGNLSMILKPTDDRSLFEIIRNGKAILKSIVVKSYPIITISYRGCKFYLSPLEWNSYVIKGKEVQLFRAVADCLHIMFPVTMLWGKKPLLQKSVPIADVYKKPQVRVYDLFIDLPKGFSLLKVKLVDCDDYGYQTRLCYQIQYPPTCSEEDLIQYTKNAKTVGEKPTSEKDEDSWDIIVDDGATVLLPSNLYELYNEICKGQVAVSQKKASQRKRSDGSEPNMNMKTRTIRKGNQREEPDLDRVPRVQLHLQPNRKSTSKPMGTRKRSDVAPGQKVEQPRLQLRPRR